MLISRQYCSSFSNLRWLSSWAEGSDQRPHFTQLLGSIDFSILNNAHESTHSEFSSQVSKSCLDGSLTSPARPWSNSGSIAKAEGLAYGEPTKSGGFSGSICQTPIPKEARASIARILASLRPPGASLLGMDWIGSRIPAALTLLSQ